MCASLCWSHSLASACLSLLKEGEGDEQREDTDPKVTGLGHHCQLFDMADRLFRLSLFIVIVIIITALSAFSS
uniref:Uncharacterized protein n=1 Tax=Caenorhabditis japonica TaxID=281687 RepID=A0A8R1ESN5_CAEJA